MLIYLYVYGGYAFFGEKTILNLSFTVRHHDKINFFSLKETNKMSLENCQLILVDIFIDRRIYIIQK